MDASGIRRVRLGGLWVKGETRVDVVGYNKSAISTCVLWILSVDVVGILRIGEVSLILVIDEQWW